MNRSFLLLANSLLLASFTVHAEIIKTIGEGKAPIIKKDQNLTRNQALNNAREDAVIAMIIKINGPKSLADAKPFLTQIVKQVDPSYYANLGSQTDTEQNLVTRISLEMDDQEFRSIDLFHKSKNIHLLDRKISCKVSYFQA